LYAEYNENAGVIKKVNGEEMLRRAALVLAVLTAAGIAAATPFIGQGGGITEEGHNDVRINLFYEQFSGAYDAGGTYTAFVPGVSRLDYRIVFDLKYGNGRDSDFHITIPYVNKLHTLANGALFTAAGIGDIIVLARKKSNENKNSGGLLTVGMGLKIPTGKSVFEVEPGILAAGTGTWDAGVVLNMQENSSGLLLFSDISFWYRLGRSAQKFAGQGIPAIKPGETEIRFMPGAILKYNAGVEISIIRQFSLVGELIGENYFESKAEYASGGADALNDLIATGAPDYTLQKSVNLRVITGVKFYLNEKVALGGGVSIPVTMANVFGNITYLAHCRLFF
jgi:hypothetical protein